MHLKAHSGEKSNKYNQCDYASSLASDLRIHLKVHSGKKPKRMQPMSLCFLSCRRFEDTFKNAQWRKVKQMQSMRLCFLSCRRFEDNVHFLICYNSVQNLSSFAGDLRIMSIFWFVTTRFKIWSLGDVSCIGSKVDYQDEVTYITTLPCDALLTLVSIGLVSLSVRVISVKFTKPLLLTHSVTDREWDP